MTVTVPEPRLQERPDDHLRVELDTTSPPSQGDWFWMARGRQVAASTGPAPCSYGATTIAAVTDPRHDTRSRTGLSDSGRTIRVGLSHEHEGMQQESTCE